MQREQPMYVQEPQPQQPMDYVEEGRQSYMDTADPNLVKHQLNINDNLKVLARQMDALGVGVKLKRQVLMALDAVANRNTFLSNFDREDIQEQGYECDYALRSSIIMDGENLSANEKDILIASCSQFLMSSLKRSLNQGERVFLAKTTETRQITQSKEPTARKTSWKSLFPKW